MAQKSDFPKVPGRQPENPFQDSRASVEFKSLDARGRGAHSVLLQRAGPDRSRRQASTFLVAEPWGILEI
jgi:hypothetical protein